MKNQRTKPTRVAVIGAGPMGLAAAYELAKAGCAVKIFERDDRIGGQSATMDFAGMRIERYYHFVCKPDKALFAYLDELGLTGKLRWAETKMGFYFDGTLHDWGNPIALLKFPKLGLIDKLRYGAHVMWSKQISDWRPYDKMSSTAWLKRWVGQKAYDTVWRSLFEYKFYDLQDELSAAWLGTRIKRVALSRKSLMKEELGYIVGGSEMLLSALLERIERLGGELALRTAVDEVVIDGGAVVGVRIGNAVEPFDQVVSTIPMPYLVPLLPGLPADERAKIAAIRNIAVVCVLLKLKRPFTPNFWLNINDSRIEIPGFIEYSNLNPVDGPNGASLLYAPYYMPKTRAKYGRPGQAFIEETIDAMRLIRPDWDPGEVVASAASRYEYAQTVCSPGFYDALVPMESKVKGLFMADTSHGYPEDRSISDSVGIGGQLAELARKAAAQVREGTHVQAASSVSDRWGLGRHG
jgi:protoporphyrinogen oxidase